MRYAKLLRKNANKTIQVVAADTGINDATISRYEAGAGMREESEAILARYFDTTVDELRRFVAEAPAEVKAHG